MPHRIASIMDYIIPKLSFLAFAIMAFLAPLKELMLFVGFAIALDFLTGYWASKTRGEKFSSRKAQRSWAKVILYPTGIVFSFCAESFAPEIPFVKGATYLLIIIEGKSLEENFSDILGISMMKYIRAFIFKGKKGVAEIMEKESNHNQNHKDE